MHTWHMSKEALLPVFFSTHHVIGPLLLQGTTQDQHSNILHVSISVSRVLLFVCRH